MTSSCRELNRAAGPVWKTTDRRQLAVVCHVSFLHETQHLAEGAPVAIARIKLLVGKATISDFDGQLDRERASFIECAATDDFREGVSAFFERRAPKF